jgi:hypothetical protein
MYAQVKASVDKLDKKGKQRILQALQKEVGAPVAKPAVAAPAQQVPAQQPAAEVPPQQQAAPEQPPVQQQPVAKPRTRKPVNISGGKKAVQPQQQVASKENLGNMVAESFSIFRKK